MSGFPGPCHATNSTGVINCYSYKGLSIQRTRLKVINVISFEPCQWRPVRESTNLEHSHDYTWHVLNMVNVTSILTTAESPVPIIPITAAPTPQGEDKGGTDPRAGSLNNSQTLPTHCFTRDSYFRLLSCASTASGWLMNSDTPPHQETSAQHLISSPSNDSVLKPPVSSELTVTG